MTEDSYLKIDEESKGNLRILHVTGKIDALTSPEFRRKLAAVIEDTPRVICDFSGVEYISSAGVGALIENKNVAEKNGGTIVLFGLRPEVLRVFSLLGFVRFFKILEDQPSAVEAIQNYKP